MDIRQVRRDNLQRLADMHGGVVALAHRIERDPSQVSRWLSWPSSNSRAISNSMAHHIEAILQLPSHWLSSPHADHLPQHPLITAACQYLNTSPDPRVADILAALIIAITPPK